MDEHSPNKIQRPQLRCRIFEVAGLAQARESGRPL